MEDYIFQIKDAMEEELKIYKNLLEITDKKTEIITSGKVSELDKMTQIEQALILKIAKLEDSREKNLQTIKNGLGITEEMTVTTLVEKVDHEGIEAIDTIKEELLETLNKIKDKNELNSILIKDSLEYINFNLNLLTSNESEHTYGDKVKKGNGSQKKSLFDAKI